MATKTLADLPEALSVSNSDVTHLQVAGVDKKTTGDRVAAMVIKNSTTGERILSYGAGASAPSSSANVLTTIIVDTALGASTLVLPTDVSMVAGSIYFVTKKATANSITITFSGATLVLPAGSRSGAIFQWDGAAWAYVGMPAEEILTRIKTVDGTGSGLDSDTVDGIHSSQIPYGEAGIAAAGINSTDLNAITKSGFYYGGSLTNAPSAGYWHVIHLCHADGTFARQTAYGYGSGNSANDIYTRELIAGTWGAWSKVWHEGNDGPGSGLNANYLSGMVREEFLTRSEAGNSSGVGTYGSTSDSTEDIDKLIKTGIYKIQYTGYGGQGTFPDELTYATPPVMVQIMHMQSTPYDSSSGYAPETPIFNAMRRACQVMYIHEASPARTYTRFWSGTLGTWAPWYKVVTSQDYGSAGDIDAAKIGGCPQDYVQKFVNNSWQNTGALATNATYIFPPGAIYVNGRLNVDYKVESYVTSTASWIRIDTDLTLPSSGLHLFMGDGNNLRLTNLATGSPSTFYYKRIGYFI